MQAEFKIRSMKTFKECVLVAQRTRGTVIVHAVFGMSERGTLVVEADSSVLDTMDKMGAVRQ